MLMDVILALRRFLTAAAQVLRGALLLAPPAT
jgi:hypothetical protein